MNEQILDEDEDIEEGTGVEEEELEGDEEVEEVAAPAAPDLADVVDALIGDSDLYDGLTASWVRGQLRKGNEILIEAFSQSSSHRWVIDVDLADAKEAVGKAWTSRKRRAKTAADVSEDENLEVEEGEEADEE